VNIKDQAQKNLAVFKSKKYHGRCLIQGMSEAGDFIQIYIVEGRSLISKDRFIVENGSKIETRAIYPEKVLDPSLIIYTAMNDRYDIHVVSNGHQTDNILKHYTSGQVLNGKDFEYEPDPSHTPRITGIIDSVKKTAEILIFKKSPFGSGCERQLYRYEDFYPGYGHCITTYNDDGDPLPSFTGEPYLLPLNGTAKEIAQEIWDSLNEENRVSLVIKTIGKGRGGKINTMIINKYQAV